MDPKYYIGIAVARPLMTTRWQSAGREGAIFKRCAGVRAVCAVEGCAKCEDLYYNQRQVTQFEIRQFIPVYGRAAQFAQNILEGV